jgi:hypothetical protein
MKLGARKMATFKKVYHNLTFTCQARETIRQGRKVWDPKIIKIERTIKTEKPDTRPGSSW